MQWTRTLGAVLLAAVAVSAGMETAMAQSAPSGDVAKRIVGAWRYIGTTIDGQNKARGDNPSGMIYYGPHGEMSVQIAPDVERKQRRRGDDAGRGQDRASPTTSPISAPTRSTRRPAP